MRRVPLFEATRLRHLRLLPALATAQLLGWASVGSVVFQLAERDGFSPFAQYAAATTATGVGVAFAAGVSLYAKQRVHRLVLLLPDAAKAAPAAARPNSATASRVRPNRRKAKEGSTADLSTASVEVQSYSFWGSPTVRRADVAMADVLPGMGAIGRVDKTGNLPWLTFRPRHERLFHIIDQQPAAVASMDKDLLTRVLRGLPR